MCLRLNQSFACTPKKGDKVLKQGEQCVLQTTLPANKTVTVPKFIVEGNEEETISDNNDATVEVKLNGVKLATGWSESDHAITVTAGNQGDTVSVFLNHSQSRFRFGANKKAQKEHQYISLASRNASIFHMNTPAPAYPGEPGVASEQLMYPMYRNNPWTDGYQLKAELAHNVKMVHRVKLVGYSLVNKRQAGIQNGHELINDDYVTLYIDEVHGGVVSNDRNAEGAFAVLQAGSSLNNLAGAVEFSQFDPTGIVNYEIPPSTNVMRSLTVSVKDRKGDPAHFGRLHLWFKLLVTHG